MGIAVFLQTERAEKRDEVLDRYGDLARSLPLGNAAFPLLQYVNPYGHTIFNKLQMPQLLEEIGWLIGNATRDEERAILEQVVSSRCVAGRQITCTYDFAATD